MTQLASKPRTAKPAPLHAVGTTGPDPRKVREAAKLSVKEMAELMGMGLNGYELWEKGARRPGGPALRLLRLIDDDADGVIATLR